jgi:phytepsin
MAQNRTWEGSSVDESAFCTFCEMIVYWVEVQLKQEKTKEKVFKYVNEVVPLPRIEPFFFLPNFSINIMCL